MLIIEIITLAVLASAIFLAIGKYDFKNSKS
jgi:hypothetical protein